MSNNWQRIYEEEKTRAFCFDQSHPVQKRFIEVLESGDPVSCPCCGQDYNKLYRRKFYKAMAFALIKLVKGGGGISPRSIGDFTKLKHWGLIAENENGTWLAMPKAYDFINGDIKIPEYCYIRNNKTVGFSDSLISLHEVIYG